MDGDPPLGECPSWCQKPAGHDWEDEWREGLVRYHTYRQEVSEHHRIGLDEIEQAAPGGSRRMREVVLDVESPTTWDMATALKAHTIFCAVMVMAIQDWPTGEVR
jgi:hypothetical protein